MSSSRLSLYRLLTTVAAVALFVPTGVVQAQEMTSSTDAMQSVTSAPAPQTPEEMCRATEEELKQNSEFTTKAAWKRILVRRGKFTVVLPHAEGWRWQGAPILPYTPTAISNEGEFTINGIKQPPTEGISFGRYALGDLCQAGVQAPEIYTASLLREYSITWTPRQTIAQLKASNEALGDPSFPPIPVTVGPYQGLIMRASFAGFCKTDALILQVGTKTFTVSSPCRRLRLEHFKIGSSIQIVP